MDCGVQVLGVVSGDKKVKKLIFSKKGGPKLFKILIESMKVVHKFKFIPTQSRKLQD